MPPAARAAAVQGSAGSRVWRWRPQLTHRIADVKLHRTGFDPQDQRDLMVGFALAGPVKDFRFARREPLCPARLGAGQGQRVLVGIDQYHLQAGPLVFHQLPQIGVIGCRGADRQDRQVVVVIVQNKAAAVHDVVFPCLAEDLPVMPILGGDGVSCHMKGAQRLWAARTTGSMR